MSTLVTRPNESEYAPGFGDYIRLVPDGDITAILTAQLDEALALLGGVSDHAGLAVQPPYAWTIKQVIGHITDSERVFGHRALWIARQGGTPLASFDENAFMSAAEFNRWPLGELVEEFAHVRRAHVRLFKHLDDAAWSSRGVVGDHPATVRAFAYVMAGHAGHHLGIVRRRLAAGS
jgi:hypothetical protein